MTTCTKTRRKPTSNAYTAYLNATRVSCPRHVPKPSKGLSCVYVDGTRFDVDSGWLERHYMDADDMFGSRTQVN